MSNPTLVVNGRRIAAAPGQTLLDAALAGRIVIPHDCASGQCTTCRVRVYDGSVDPNGTLLNDTVLACRATVAGDAVIEFDEIPAETTMSGVVHAIETLTPSILQVTVGLTKRPIHLAGQYLKVRFRGFPERDYSPTLRVDGSAELNELVFHIRREAGGRLSSALGRGIVEGHPVRVRGPFGTAFHRLGPGRLVLVAGGVGFAPIWAIARASRLREPGRPLVVVAGARAFENLYMRESLDWLREQGAAATLTCSELASDRGGARAGRPTLHLPLLVPSDTVVAAGTPAMVAAVEMLCATRGATCHADPFRPAGAAHEGGGFLERLFGMMGRRDRSSPAPVPDESLDVRAT